jgi:hypothetical protein
MRTTFGRIAAYAFIATLFSVSVAVAAESERPQVKPVAAKEADKPQLSEQQNRMKACNAEAAKKELKGDERKAFMSSCLKARHD